MQEKSRARKIPPDSEFRRRYEHDHNTTTTIAARLLNMTYPQHFIVNAALSLFIFFIVTKGAYCNVDLHSKALEGRSAESASFTFEKECIAPGLCSGGGDAREAEEEWKGHSEARTGLLGLFESLGVAR